MKNIVLASSILWIAALGVVSYLFRGNENTAIAVIIIAILGAVDIAATQTFFKEKK